ncbi:PTS system N-acetylglucosamine-specific IIA component (Glc family) [Tamaricihabitans halophyticus]|uniref:PTS system N-acetylglucosamine-specific IIA component (Glc family) n=1 Tax=Tamaricihabitans halophyticus TaxID=1262583 RepID=A0A4R2QGY8_9PSEU|nr:PTS glucose transporter subunit IIA [Tamaricihabitans halophyticus]TCP46275.1 PTS system N-acetylglucosamine-specific IIA component (Glc family) [Tamaricihabitans halophyticus]
MSLRVLSPVSGRTAALAEVPDPVFAQSMVGPGIAVWPDTAGAALAPVAGTVATLHAHAFVVVGADGQGVLVHLGIDTVQLKGEGFTLHVVKGETVRAGQPIVDWDPVAVRAAGYSPICPVVALDAAADALDVPQPDIAIAAGDPLFTWRD